MLRTVHLERQTGSRDQNSSPTPQNPAAGRFPIFAAAHFWSLRLAIRVPSLPKGFALSSPINLRRPTRCEASRASYNEPSRGISFTHRSSMPHTLLAYRATEESRTSMRAVLVVVANVVEEKSFQMAFVHC